METEKIVEFEVPENEDVEENTEVSTEVEESGHSIGLYVAGGAILALGIEQLAKRVVIPAGKKLSSKAKDLWANRKSKKSAKEDNIVEGEFKEVDEDSEEE